MDDQVSKRKVHDRRDRGWRERDKPRSCPRARMPPTARWVDPEPIRGSPLEQMFAVLRTLDPFTFDLFTGRFRRPMPEPEPEPESVIVCDAEGEFVGPSELPPGEGDPP